MEEEKYQVQQKKPLNYWASSNKKNKQTGQQKQSLTQRLEIQQSIIDINKKDQDKYNFNSDEKDQKHENPEIEEKNQQYQNQARNAQNRQKNKDSKKKKGLIKLESLPSQKSDVNSDLQDSKQLFGDTEIEESYIFHQNQAPKYGQKQQANNKQQEKQNEIEQVQQLLENIQQEKQHSKSISKGLQKEQISLKKKKINQSQGNNKQKKIYIEKDPNNLDKQKLDIDEKVQTYSNKSLEIGENIIKYSEQFRNEDNRQKQLQTDKQKQDEQNKQISDQQWLCEQNKIFFQKNVQNQQQQNFRLQMKNQETNQVYLNNYQQNMYPQQRIITNQNQFSRGQINQQNSDEQFKNLQQQKVYQHQVQLTMLYQQIIMTKLEDLSRTFKDHIYEQNLDKQIKNEQQYLDFLSKGNKSLQIGQTIITKLKELSRKFRDQEKQWAYQHQVNVANQYEQYIINKLEELQKIFIGQINQQNQYQKCQNHLQQYFYYYLGYISMWQQNIIMDKLEKLQKLAGQINHQKLIIQEKQLSYQNQSNQTMMLGIMKSFQELSQEQKSLDKYNLNPYEQNQLQQKMIQENNQKYSENARNQEITQSNIVQKLQELNEQINLQQHFENGKEQFENNESVQENIEVKMKNPLNQQFLQNKKNRQIIQQQECQVIRFEKQENKKEDYQNDLDKQDLHQDVQEQMYFPEDPQIIEQHQQCQERARIQENRQKNKDDYKKYDIQQEMIPSQKIAVPFIQRDMEGKIAQAQSMEINLENRLIVKLRDEIERDNFYSDELNKRICLGRNLIFQTLRKIEDKKEQFEKEKKQMLQGQVEIKQLMLYQSIKNEFTEAIKNLKGSQEFELIAQIYYKLGMYEEAVQCYQQFKDFLQSSPNFSQDKSKIKEIDSNIKQIYFEKANILETNNNQKALEQNYIELESFLEKAGIQDTKVQLYLSFRLNNYEKLFNNLIKFKENDLIEQKDLIHILHYYYPKILELKLQQIMLINTNEGSKQKLLQGPKTALGQVLIELIQQVIIPFKDEFVRIAKSRQNMEFFQEQLKYFNKLSNTHQLKQLDQEQKYLNGYYLMLFYVMLIQFDCSKQQKKFNDILQQQELSHQMFIDQILRNMNQPNIIKNIQDEMKQLPWLQSGKIEKQISPDYQYYYAYLGLYDQLKSRNLVGSSQDNHKYLNFTFQLKSFDQFQQLDDLYNQIYYIQRVIVNGQLFKMGSIQKNDISYYKQINSFLNLPVYNKFLYLKFLIQTVNDIVAMINQKQINQTSAIKKFISCQDLFLSFFLCLQKLKEFNMHQLENEFIIKFIDLTKFFFNFNYQFLESSLYGEFNGIFQDAFCSCFGFISPYLPGQSIFDKDFKYTWQLLGYSDYYLINLDNPYLDKSLIGEDKLISPILSPEFSKIKIIEKKTAMMLCKKQFGQYCTEFMKRYSEFLIKKIYEDNYYQRDPIIKIYYPFQILYLNKCLQQMIQNIDQQTLILEQNIPKNHIRQHEIESIKNLIDQIENSDQKKQNEQKIQNLKKLLQKKLNSQKRDKQQIKIIKKEIRLLDDNQIYKCKSNIIQSGLVINKILHSKSVEEDRNQILQYLLDEASNLLALILNKIEQKDNQNEIQQSFENLKKQFEDQQTKYKKQYDQQFSITKDLNQDQNLIINKEEENKSSKNQGNDLVELIIQQEVQQSKESGEIQKEEEKEDEDEEIQKEGENILQSCDDILYAFTILNMCDQRLVIKDLFIGFEKNQLTQFTQLCYQFFESRNSYDRINIGLLSNQLLLLFRENINYFTQINIFQIGLAEIYLQLNCIEDAKKATKVCIPSGFENCFSFNTTANGQQEVKDSEHLEDYEQIKSQINKIKNSLNQNITDELNEQKCINIFYKQDFTIFMSQVVYSNQPTYCIFDSQIQQQLQKFEDNFLKTIIQIQKVRKIFLQELSLKKFQSSEKYIYVIQKLNSIAKQEKEFYRQMIQTEQLIIENSQEFQQKLEQNSIWYINLMEKVYSDYLHYVTEPFEKIEKENFDIQKFIEEQINTKN
ncbi:hypothetical protein ABPG73_021016 [Tetrahymena malaccensis]